MANLTYKTGSSKEISDGVRPLNAEADKLTEKCELFTSAKLTESAGKLRKKIGFQDSGEDLISCLSVMRRLMEEAENENRQLKQDKFLISSKIGNALGAVNREVEKLRLELQKQDKRLVELSCQNARGEMQWPYRVLKEELRRVREEKEKLQAENKALSMRYNDLSEKAKNLDQLREQVRTCKEDIARANETISCINVERRRLKSEKLDLVGQLREAYCIIEDKESELRDFITTYEEKMRESEQRLETLTKEKRQWEEERCVISAGEPAQIALLRKQLDEKDVHVNEMEVELCDLKTQLDRLQETLKRSVYKWDNPLSPMPVIKLEDPESFTNCDSFTLQDSSAVANSPAQLSSSNHLVHSNPDIYSNCATESEDITYFKKRKRYTRLSRVFGRGKNKKTTERRDRPPSSLSSDCDSDISDVVQIWEANKTVPISQWRASAVVAFLHHHLQMSMYTDRCMENVKSGKMLADMSDSELTRSLGIINYLHRRKIRLAIEDFRHPASVKNPRIGEVDHHYVAHDWLTHVGLDQYRFTFETQMVDGRLLSSMTRKDFEKYLNITSKFHQDSILYGVELLKNLSFNQETFAKRKERCDEYDHDPLVWSNERIIRWCDSINLKEYSSNLRSSGVHGALLVLNQSFGPEELANCLNIPAEKTGVRKRLLRELTSLMINTRSSVRSRGSRRSFRSRSKSFTRQSSRKSGYNVLNTNTNGVEQRKLTPITGPNRRTQRPQSSPDISSNRKQLTVRRSATLERPKSTADCEQDLED